MKFCEHMQKQYLLSNRNDLQQMKGDGSQLINAYFNSDDLDYRYSSRELLHRPFFGSTGRHCTIISSYDTYTTYVDTEQKFRQVLIK